MSLPMWFDTPEWFCLCILAPFAWRRLALHRPLRCITLTLIIAALAGLSISWSRSGVTLWVLVDRSLSVHDPLNARLSEWEGIIESNRPSDSTVRYVDFASAAALRPINPGYVYEDRFDQSKIAGAIRFALSHMDRGENNRLLLLSDGYGTDDVTAVRETLLRQDIALDNRLIELQSAGDVSIESLNVPLRSSVGDSFLVEVVVKGPAALDPNLNQPRYQVLRNNVVIADGEVELVGGRATLRFSDKIRETGGYRYEARVSLPNDPISGNNAQSAWTEVVGAGSILLLSPYDNDPVEAILRKRNWNVVRPAHIEDLTLGSLAGVKAVVFNNIHASLVPRDFLESLNFFVVEQGGGLLMLGGENSFGSGGYFSSPLDTMLPVSMEMREEFRRIPVAMALVLDRSGSMGVSVAGNMGNMLKMDLANEGAARTAELLSPFDELAVFAVDSEPHSILPLRPVGSDPKGLQSRIRSISVGGGGIYVFTGLEAAWKELKGTRIARKHIVLFSDAADSEEPGGYKALLKEITANKATVSVIGLGSRRDSDAAFLEDVAKLGGGRIFFVNNAVDLPSVFAQETTSIARSLFIKDPTGVMGTPDWATISSEKLAWLPQVDGYNLTYRRPEAQSSALSRDRYNAPLVATAQRGLGRAAAVTFPCAGEHSDSQRNWDLLGDFLQTIVTWTAAPELPAGLTLHSHHAGTSVVTDLYYGNSWEQQILSTPPKLVATSRIGDSTSPTRHLPWERLSPGHFRATLEVDPGSVARGAIQVGRYSLPFGPLGSQSDIEWTLDELRRRDLRELSRVTGGREIIDLKDTWRLPKVAGMWHLANLLLWVALLLFLIEALLFRLDLSLPELPTRISWSALRWPHSTPSLNRWRVARRVSSGRVRDGNQSPESSSADGLPPLHTTPQLAPSKPAVEHAEESLSARLARAKRRGKE